MPNHKINRLRVSCIASFFFVLLFIISTPKHAMAEVFSVHLVHPNNHALVSSLNTDLDLRDYVKVTFPKNKDEAEILWISKKIEIHITDLEEAHLTVQKPPSREELEYARKYYNLEIAPEPVPAISISFTSSGSKKWADFTIRNVKRRAAIILDGIPLMAPIIQEPITSGTMQIVGDFSEEEIQSIVDRINALISKNRSM
jgi:hypothetical protein